MVFSRDASQPDILSLAIFPIAFIIGSGPQVAMKSKEDFIAEKAVLGHKPFFAE